MKLNEALQLQVRDGFKVTQFADAALTGDARTMALDADGRVYVSSRGWIRRLVDADKDGKAERYVTFAETPEGASGMCFYGSDLYFVGDGWFSRYLDQNGDGVADGPPQRLFELNTGPFGAHAIRRGPDGAWFILGGHETSPGSALWNHPQSPVKSPRAGVLIHISADFTRSEIIAEGFYNATDFDFNRSGDIFLADNDVVADYLLPWYPSARLHHVAHGGDHGWRATGERRGWLRPDYYPDAVTPVWLLDRAAPTGLVVYQHHQFPKSFRDGVLVGDWLNGRLLAFSTGRIGATYGAEPTELMRGAGDSGFAPTDLSVAPDGSVFVSSGGRQAHGAIYRLEYVKTDPATGVLPDQPGRYLGEFDYALRAPQRLEAWSRKRWEAAARTTGLEAFEQVLTSLQNTVEAKTSAIEVLVDFTGGISDRAAKAGSMSPSPLVRMKTAWAVGRRATGNAGVVLGELVNDSEPAVQLAALNAASDLGDHLPGDRRLEWLHPNLLHSDKRVATAAARLAARLSENHWRELVRRSAKAPASHQLMVALASTWREGPAGYNDFAAQTALKILSEPEKGTPELGIRALRLLALAFGDWNVHGAEPGVHAPYSLNSAVALDPEARAAVLETVRPLFPTGNSLVDAELARVLAMFEDDDPAVFNRMLGAFGDRTPPGSDFHYLTALSRLSPPTHQTGATNLVEVFFWMDNKLEGRITAKDQEWITRFEAVTAELFRKHPPLVKRVTADPRAQQTAHFYVLRSLPGEQRDAIARTILSRLRAQPELPLTPVQVQLLAGLEGGDDLAGLVRSHWKDPALRSSLIGVLARDPQPLDEMKFVEGLTFSDWSVVGASLKALSKLELDNPRERLLPVMRLLRRAMLYPELTDVRRDAVAWVEAHFNIGFNLVESARDQRSLGLIYQPVFVWLDRNHPEVARELDGLESRARHDYWKQEIAALNQVGGNRERGRAVYVESGCAKCHGGGDGYGPSLSGVTRRFAPAELLRAIVSPDRDIAPGYERWSLALGDGRNVEGFLIHEAPDVVLFRTDERNLRLSPDQITSLQRLRSSFMPHGLLDDYRSRDLASLYAHLLSL